MSEALLVIQNDLFNAEYVKNLLNEIFDTIRIGVDDGQVTELFVESIYTKNTQIFLDVMPLKQLPFSEIYMIKIIEIGIKSPMAVLIIEAQI